VTLVALALMLLGAGAAAAQPKAPSISRTTLPNGMVVLVRENPVAPVVAYSLMVKMGTRWETRDVAGISNLLQLMVVRGTTKLDGLQIVQAADRMGGSIEAVADADQAEISATALSRNWTEMLELVADVALYPSLPEGTLGAVRDFLITQIRNRGEKPQDVAQDTVLARVFGDHSYAWDPVGLRESLSKVDRTALIAHYRRHYVPGAMVLAVSGQVKTAEVVAAAQRLFGGIAAGPVPVPRVATPPAPATSREVIRVPGAQAQIMMGGLAPALTDADYAAVKVLGSLLGGGMASRFFSELRDKQGLAYTTTLRYPTRVEQSMVVAQLGTAPENAAKAEAALQAELARIQRESPTDDELRVAQAYLLGTLAMDRRTNARQAWYLAAYEQAGVGHEFLDRYPQGVRAVTAADVQRVARRYLSVLRTVIVAPPAP
jgi:predicted Zn-dependent peptidase